MHLIASNVNVVSKGSDEQQLCVTNFPSKIFCNVEFGLYVCVLLGERRVLKHLKLLLKHDGGKGKIEEVETDAVV